MKRNYIDETKNDLACISHSTAYVIHLYSRIFTAITLNIPLYCWVEICRTTLCVYVCVCICVWRAMSYNLWLNEHYCCRCMPLCPSHPNRLSGSYCYFCWNISFAWQRNKNWKGTHRQKENTQAARRHKNTQHFITNNLKQWTSNNECMEIICQFISTYIIRFVCPYSCP